MENHKLYADENLREEEDFSAFGNMLYFPEMDEDVEVIAFLPIEEVETRLASMGADPNVPFPAALIRMLSEEEKQIGSESNLSAFKDRSTKAKLFGILAYLRVLRPGLSDTICYALMLLVIFQVFCVVRYISLSREVQQVREEIAAGDSTDLDRNADSRSIEPLESSAGDTNARVVKAGASGNEHRRRGKRVPYEKRETQRSSENMRASGSPAFGDNAPSVDNNPSSKSKDELRPVPSGSSRNRPPEPLNYC